MKALKSKLKKAKTPKVQFSIYDTHWIDLEFINHENFTHRKLHDFTLEDMPFVSTGIYDFYVMWWFRKDAVRIMHDRVTDLVLICAGDYALYAGYQDLDDFMMDNSIMDACIFLQNINGRFPIRKIEVKPVF
jgi:hypothetical protein